MRFIRENSEGGYHLEDYISYLKSVSINRDREVMSFAAAEWHYDYTDKRCPHDSWLQSFIIREEALNVNQQTKLVVGEGVFLGAYHNGLFNITYRGISKYEMVGETTKGHKDWMVDEILFGDNYVSHEIEFDSGSRIFIQCSTFLYSWKDIENSI